MDMSPDRPILRYHGGKWLLAPWIISHFPSHRVYVEPYGGAASVLLRKSRSYAEVYNDLDSEIVNLFRVLRDQKQSVELRRMVSLTPYSRLEFKGSYTPSDNPIEQARRTLFRAAAGYATGAQVKYGTGFRGNVTRSGSTPAKDWSGMANIVDQVADRMMGVVIENDTAVNVMERYDSPDTLFYLDPPYVFETRNEQNAGQTYRHEMTDGDHAEMGDALRNLNGMVIVSGYECSLYDDELFAGWSRIQRVAMADGARARRESIWLSPNIQQRLSLFPLDEY